MRKAVLAKWGALCWLCHKRIDLDAPTNSTGALSLDHVVPRAYGGLDNVRNLRPAHRECNSLRGNRYASSRPRLRVFG